MVLHFMDLSYLGGYSVVLFRCKWFNTGPSKNPCVTKNNITGIVVHSEWYKDDQYILATKAKQVFYIADPFGNRNQRVVEDVNHRKIWDHPSVDSANEIDVVHDHNSSNFVLTANLDELPDISLERVGHSSMVHDNSTLHAIDDANFINDEDDDVDADADIELLDDIEDVADDDVDNDDADAYCSSAESD